jgi:hypothetical protein
MKNLDLVEHCKEIKELAGNDHKYFLISHSRGWIMADVFASLFTDKIVGHINLDGGETKERAKQRIDGWKSKYEIVIIVSII